ncbi:rCG29918, isoform CRA_b [Rattus norvegicus]|uniref:RCG29918, isoform CRA_b n=1 Tax=Rattus norvegicus TaxID=10116 RepID=A6ILL9_RAT|nr:rCG29918, isoform CRA_b [Rattus norvegicus]
MGSTQSVSGTPARPLPRNKHVSRVADPRSPSAGIQRTPIQVESSPQPNPPAEQLNSLKQAQDPDPRSPTLGIARTPMKISGPGSKRSRRKTNNKVLGRSPLTILQDDNSPGTLTLRQGKRPSALSENVKDLKEGVILGTGRFLKAGGGAWEQNEDHDKENQHFALMES